VSNSDSRRCAAALRQQQIRARALQAGEAARRGPELRFVADVMLGRLARWLRIAGFDVLYSNRFSDDELLLVARREGRVLLSRDTRLLVRKAAASFVYLESDRVQDQVRQILALAGTLPGPLSRCLDCNEPLLEVEREKVRNRVPVFVFETQPRFKQCPGCGKIYWAGTHRHAVLRALETLSGLAQK